jgi:alpha-2-macroglobulin
VVLPNGDTTRRPDYEKALTLYRRLLAHYPEGGSRWWREATSGVERITSPSLNLSVSNVFLPGSEVDFQLAWRNAAEIQLSITRVDLPQDIRFGATWNPLNWKDSLPLGDRAPLKRWIRKPDTAPHQPGSGRIVVNGKLPVGAYVLNAHTAGADARELLLVSDLALVARSGVDRTLIYVTDALTGAPVAGAHLLLGRHHGGVRNEISEQRADSGPDGTASFVTTPGWNDFVVFTRSGDRQAFAAGWSNGLDAERRHPWKVYAFADRPAYRPGETVHWKYVARRIDESGYSLPADAALRFEILDPRGAKVGSGAPQLNRFGSAWGELALTDSMPLGEYHAVFYDGSSQVGSATLFRIEEYKLPEFQVVVRTPEENGRKKVFRLGDTVDAEIEASYYFGGPVTNADVEVIVHQQPLVHFWHRPGEYSWIDSVVPPAPYGDVPIVMRTPPWCRPRRR